jgi:hypothetical protein
MDCARCGKDCEAPILEDGSPGILDSVMQPPEGGRPFELLKFRLFRGADGANEIRRLDLCPDCARRLSDLVWQFVDGKVTVIWPSDGPAQPGGVM